MWLLRYQLVSALQQRNPQTVVVILADDMGWGDVGYHGVDDIRTPNIDKLAKGGTWFPQAYVTASVCGPSRAGISFLACTSKNLAITATMKTLSVIPHGQQNLAEMMKELGYKTGMIGKVAYWLLRRSPAMEPGV